jgi:polysaccharide biosynthesis transport protein
MMQTSDERPSNLRDYLDVLWRRKLVIALALIVVPAVAVAMSVREPSLYRASASVLINLQNLPANLENIPDPTQFDSDRSMRTQVQLARVPEVARRTIAAAKLKNWDPSDLLGISSVSPGDSNDLMTFSVTLGDRTLAATLATEYARQYTKYRRDLDTASLRAARKAAARRIAVMQRAGDTRSALYATLVEREQQLETLQTLYTARAVLVRAASGAGQVQPQPRRKAMFGIGLGLMLGLGLAVLLEALDTRVRSSDVIAERLQLQLLARVPAPPRFRKKDKLVMLVDPNGPEAESFRILRTNLEFANMEESGRTILVTSAVEGEGKSTTVANLAVACARAGRRVVLVDLDLRSSSLHRFFGLAAAPGLTDIVMRGVPVEQAISHVEIGTDRWYRDGSGSGAIQGRWATMRPSDGSNGARKGMAPLAEGKLGVLPAGTLPSNPGEFVAHLPLGPIFDYLKGQNDLVLIDGPPLLRVGDTVTLSSAVDALVVVARLNVVRARMLDDLGRILRTCPATKLGLVLAGAELEPGYGYLSYPRNRQKAVV